MKKYIKRTLWSLGSILILFILCIIIMIIIVSCARKKLHPLETGQIMKNIFVIKDDTVNFFIFKNGNDIIIIDTGENLQNIISGFKKLGINPNKVKAVFITHSDNDHVGGVLLFKNARIYISRSEEMLAKGKIRRFLFKKNHIGGNFNYLNDNQLVTIGDNLVKCILTPGHTPGSMSYIINGKYLFIGDAFGL